MSFAVGLDGASYDGMSHSRPLSRAETGISNTPQREG
jgi:hypothetical protein